MTEPAKIIIGHTRVAGDPEPCMVCEQLTDYQAVLRPFAAVEGFGAIASAIEFRRRLCGSCVEDAKGAARVLARTLGSLRTGTRTGGDGSEP
jgi:hypothetical protein